MYSLKLMIRSDSQFRCCVLLVLYDDYRSLFLIGAVLLCDYVALLLWFEKKYMTMFRIVTGVSIFVEVRTPEHQNTRIPEDQNT